MSRNKDKKDTAENQDFILSYLECLWLNVLSEPEVRQKKKKKKKDTDTDQQIGGVAPDGFLLLNHFIFIKFPDVIQINMVTFLWTAVGANDLSVIFSFSFNQLYSMEQNSLKWAVTDKWFT